MEVWQSKENDKWVLSYDNGSITFNTALEANNMAKKLDFATQIQTLATDLAKSMEVAPDLHQRYFDCGFNDGGANEIVDGDIESLGFTAAQLVSMITCIENFNKFIAGTSPANSAYRININALRK